MTKPLQTQVSMATALEGIMSVALPMPLLRVKIHEMSLPYFVLLNSNNPQSIIFITYFGEGPGEYHRLLPFAYIVQ